MWPNPQETEETVDLVKFTEEILNGKLHFLFSVVVNSHQIFQHQANIANLQSIPAKEL